MNKDNPKFVIFTYTLEDDFKTNSILEVNFKLLYDYTGYNNIGSLMHILRLYDENNLLIHEYKNLKTNAGDNLKDDLNHIDLFYDYSVNKIELILSILDTVTKSVSYKLYNSLSSNFLCIKYIKKKLKIFIKVKNIFSKITQYFMTFVKCITKYYRLNR